MSIQILFNSSELSKTPTSIQAWQNQNNELFIEIVLKDEPVTPWQLEGQSFVALDLPTAIKFVKHLKFHISQMKQDEQA
jgi:hypothetical protein